MGASKKWGVRVVRILYFNTEGMSRTKIVMIIALDDALPPIPETPLLVKHIQSIEPDVREIQSIMENPTLNAAVSTLLDRLGERSPETDRMVMETVVAAWDLRVVRPVIFSKPASQRNGESQADTFFFS